jgi:hypothetical protein
MRWRQHDAVLIPAEDGGYVLIGLALPIAELFEGVDWGSPAVMRQTRDRLAAANVTSVELPALWDVDRPRTMRACGAKGSSTKCSREGASARARARASAAVALAVAADASAPSPSRRYRRASFRRRGGRCTSPR